MLQILFLFLYRGLFICKYFYEIKDPLNIFLNSIQVDVSTVSYITLGFLVLVLLLGIFKYKKAPSLLNSYSVLICIIVLVVEYASLTIYKHWGATISYRALTYLEDGTSGWNTATENFDLYLLPSIFIFVIHLYINRKLIAASKSHPISLYSILLLPVLLVLIRGGFQKIPISSSKSFFSKNQSDNYSAVNKVRYFFDSYLNSNSYNTKIKTNTTYANIDSIMNINCINYEITTAQKPDIILLVMEGVPNAALKIKQNEEYITKNINRISQSGIRYTNAFSSGFRTDQGIVSIFNGLPAYPFLNTLKKYDRLSYHDNLIDEIRKEEYKTSFIYGGESQFSDLKKYFLTSKLDNLLDSDYFPKSSRSSSWGVPDHILLDTAYNYISRSNTPSFTTILTSSTHVPFDFPNHDPRELSVRDNFIASIKYLDSALGEFERRLSKLDGRDFILIIISDHGSMHLGHGYNDHERFHVPLLVTGNCIDTSLINTKKHKNISLHDIPKSILKLARKEDCDSLFSLSSNIFSECSQSNSYWITDNALGYIENAQNLGLEHRNGNVFQHNLLEDSLSLKDLQQNAISTFYYYNNFLLQK